MIEKSEVVAKKYSDESQVLQNTINNMAINCNLENLINKVKIRLSVMDIRTKLFVLNIWIGQIEVSTRDNVCRKEIFWNTVEPEVIILIGGREVVEKLNWSEVKTCLLGFVKELDPVDIMKEMESVSWLGVEEPLSFVISLKSKVMNLTEGKSMKINFDKIAKNALIRKMNEPNKQMWGALFVGNFNNTLNMLSRKWYEQGQLVLGKGNDFYPRKPHNDARTQNSCNSPIYERKYDHLNNQRVANDYPPYLPLMYNNAFLLNVFTHTLISIILNNQMNQCMYMKV